MSIQLSPTATAWIQTATTLVSVLLFVIGLASVPEDLATWHGWISWLQSGVPWWAFLLTAGLLLAFTWVPRLRVVAPIPANELPRVEGTNIPAVLKPVTEQVVEAAESELRALRLEVERLNKQVAGFRALPNRVVGLLAAGRALSLRELRQQLSVADSDRDGNAALEGCIGELGSRRIVEHYSGSIDSYVLTKDWHDRFDRASQQIAAPNKPLQPSGGSLKGAD